VATQTEELAALKECIAAWHQDRAGWLARHGDEPYPHMLTILDLEDARDMLCVGVDDGR